MCRHNENTVACAMPKRYPARVVGHVIGGGGNKAAKFFFFLHIWLEYSDNGELVIEYLVAQPYTRGSSLDS